MAASTAQSSATQKRTPAPKGKSTDAWTGGPRHKVAFVPVIAQQKALAAAKADATSATNWFQWYQAMAEVGYKADFFTSPGEKSGYDPAEVVSIASGKKSEKFSSTRLEVYNDLKELAFNLLPAETRRLIATPKEALSPGDQERKRPAHQQIGKMMSRMKSKFEAGIAKEAAAKAAAAGESSGTPARRVDTATKVVELLNEAIKRIQADDAPGFVRSRVIDAIKAAIKLVAAGMDTGESK